MRKQVRQSPQNASSIIPAVCSPTRVTYVMRICSGAERNAAPFGFVTCCFSPPFFIERKRKVGVGNRMDGRAATLTRRSPSDAAGAFMAPRHATLPAPPPSDGRAVHGGDRVSSKNPHRPGLLAISHSPSSLRGLVSPARTRPPFLSPPPPSLPLLCLSLPRPICICVFFSFFVLGSVKICFSFLGAAATTGVVEWWQGGRFREI